MEIRKQKPIQRLANQRIRSFLSLLKKSRKIAPTAGSHVTHERMPIPKNLISGIYRVSCFKLSIASYRRPSAATLALRSLLNRFRDYLPRKPFNAVGIAG